MSQPAVSEDAFVAQLDPKQRPKLSKPRWDQSTYWGRANHFFTVTNPMNLLCTSAQLEEAKKVVEDYMIHDKIHCKMTVDELWRAKNIFDSAYHPETHEVQFILGRMSAQVPMNMTITGCMMTFYRSTPAVIFWQWINQSFNAVVNYTNRSGGGMTNTQLATSYGMATSASVITALGLNALTKSAPALVGRLVPLAAVCAANAVNIPLMRKQEIDKGITLLDEQGHKVGVSSTAAKYAISQVVLSRCAMASPGMVIPPITMVILDKKIWWKAYSRTWSAPLQVMMCGAILSLATPLCCALFPQQSSIAVSSLEPEVQASIKANFGDLETVYYNKGL